MRRVKRDGPLFDLRQSASSIELIATGETSPYEISENWGNGGNVEAPKELGQVATPPEIAQIMAKWVTAHNPSTILDPAAGLGNLLYEAHRLCPSSRLIGIEQDIITHNSAVLCAPAGTRLILADYLKHRIEKVDAVIANPPYVKAHHLEYSDNDWAYFDSLFGASLNRLTNLYALFLLKIFEDLTHNGRAAVIIPAEFLNANFGVPIKERILKAIRPFGIAVFDTSFQVFKKALTTSCILFLLKGRNSSSPIIARKVRGIGETELFVKLLLDGSLASLPEEEEYFDISSWKPTERWLNKILGTETKGLDVMPRTVGDYFRCKRGIATGANEYFTLSAAEIESKKLRISDFSPCIVHATHAKKMVFRAEDFIELARSGKKCYLLDPKEVHRNLDEYLAQGVKSGIPDRFLPSHRPVWYLPEKREPADIWIGVFSRESLKCILNLAKAKNLTCFHGMYQRIPQPGLPEMMTLFLNSTLGKTSFGQVNRFYGNGLNKLEPKDVEAMPCPGFSECTDKEAKRLQQLIIELDQYPPVEKQTRIDTVLAALLGFSC